MASRPYLQSQSYSPVFGGVVYNVSVGFSKSGGVNLTTATITEGYGSPEGAVVAAVGSVYLQLDGTTDTTHWTKDSGAGNTGWVSPAAAKQKNSANIINITADRLADTFFYYIADAALQQITVSLPPAADHEGLEYTVKKTDSSAFKVIIDPDGTENIDGTSTSLELEYQHESITVVSDGTDWWVI
jgi:hypothetical protein